MKAIPGKNATQIGMTIKNNAQSYQKLLALESLLQAILEPMMVHLGLSRST